MSRPVDGEPFVLVQTLEGLRLPLSEQSRQALRAQVFAYVDALKKLAAGGYRIEGRRVV